VKYVNFIRKYVSGCEDAYISATPFQIALRESNRIVGEYYLTGEDERRGLRHKDVIDRCFYVNGVLS